MHYLYNFQNESAVNKAEEVLYMEIDLSYHIPKHLVSKVIGEDGQKLKNIIDRSGVVRLNRSDPSIQCIRMSSCCSLRDEKQSLLKFFHLFCRHLSIS